MFQASGPNALVDLPLDFGVKMLDFGGLVDKAVDLEG